jgi:hypothetical protein
MPRTAIGSTPAGHALPRAPDVGLVEMPQAQVDVEVALVLFLF